MPKILIILFVLWIVWKESLLGSGLSHFHFLNSHINISLKKNSMSLAIGLTAPDFTLYDSEKNKVSLSDFKGNKNVLLLFFPMAFTGVCTEELCAIRDDMARYENANAQVLGISVDSVFTLAKFKEEQSYNFPLLSDFNKDTSKTYGSIYESFTPMMMKGVSKRAAFIVDKTGILQYEEVLENAREVPNFKVINSKLESLD